jgi:hypothetical protein
VPLQTFAPVPVVELVACEFAATKKAGEFGASDAEPVVVYGKLGDAGKLALAMLLLNSWIENPWTKPVVPVLFVIVKARL